MSVSESVAQSWVDICGLTELAPNAGCGALLGQQQIALFYLPGAPEQVFAIGNYDPLGDANVLARGIVGSVGEQLVVASPLYKQRFDLRTGQCLDDPAVSVPCYAARVSAGRVEVLA